MAAWASLLASRMYNLRLEGLMALQDLDRYREQLLSIFRIVVGLLFMQHGTQKLFAFPVAEPREPVELVSQMGLAGILEVFGGFLIVIGLFTRIVAVVLTVEMLWAYVQAHLPQSIWPILNRGEPALLYAASYLYLIGAGAGVWSVDHKLGRWRRREHVTT